MALKDIAVAYNGGDNANAALRYGLLLAQQHGATVTGVHIGTHLEIERRLGRWITDDVVKSVRAAESESESKIEQSFHEAIAAQDYQGPIDWISDEGPANDLLARIARYYDLLLVGQFSDREHVKRKVRAEDLVLRSGTPLITLPLGYQSHPRHEHAVIAWDGSRPAARALTDAMQILEADKRIDVLTVQDGESKAKVSDQKGPDIITHLQRHGIDAKRVSVPLGPDGVGKTILDYCKEHDPDLLVMGAYNHARLREDLFGGVTRYVLSHMTVPVLMAH